MYFRATFYMPSCNDSVIITIRVCAIVVLLFYTVQKNFLFISFPPPTPPQMSVRGNKEKEFHRGNHHPPSSSILSLSLSHISDLTNSCVRSVATQNFVTLH